MPELRPLVSNRGQASLELRAAFDENLVKDLTGYTVHTDEVTNLTPEQRVDLIELLCGRLQQLAHHNSAGTSTTER
jgi:hypothetical protein